ncbi:MAG: hypothetical protein ALAOOOJD_01108 [bacterium]|nr:hypothetical protein [bacterium]
MYANNFKEPSRRQLDFQGALQALRRRVRLVLLCLAVVMTGVVLYNEFSTPVYEAVATIICEAPQDNILIIETGRPALLSRNAMFNLIEKLKSRALTQELAQALPEEVVRTFIGDASVTANCSREELIIKKIQESLTVQMLPGSDILQIKVTANDPAVAKTIANTYVALSIDWNVQKRRNEISRTREFVEKQFAGFQERLNAAEKALQTFKEENRMTALSNASADILGRMTETEAKYNEMKTERAVLEQRQRMIAEKKKELAPSLAIGSSPQIQQLKQQLGELERQRASLEAHGARPDQPEMAAVAQKIGRVKEELIQQLTSTTDLEIISDPLSQKKNLLQESITLEVDLETYRAREQGLKNILAEYDKEIQALPQQEVELARLIRERDVNDKIYSMLLQKREELRIAEASKYGQVQLIDAAQQPGSPLKPEKTKNLALGFFLGLFIGVAVVLLLETLDTSLKSPQDVEEHVNLPVLASIPSIHPNGKRGAYKSDQKSERSYAGRLLSQLEAGSHVYEAYRALQIKFALVNGSTVLKSILVTSSNAAEGKTLTAINMAQAFAQNGIKTLLVDCDLRRPMIHHILGLNQEPGLSDMLKNHIVSIEKVVTSWAIQAPENENLFVFPCGTLPPNPYELLAAQRMREVLAEFKRHYDLVIIDSPPLMAVTDSIALGGEVDGVCLVIKSGRTRQNVALRAKNLLENSQTNIIGTILNGMDTEAVNGYDGSNHYIN